MRTLFVRRCPDLNDMLRFALGLCAAVLIVFLLVLPDDSEAAQGFLWGDNCYANALDAQRAYAERTSAPVYFFSPSGVLYRRSITFASNSLMWWEQIETVDVATLNGTIVGMKAISSSGFPACTYPDTAPGLVGNAQITVFSPMYETARTLDNTQRLMIFLWIVATFFLGFKFGYFVMNSGGGKHDTF